MKVIAEGHIYDLDNFENDDSQRIQFIRKETGTNPSGVVEMLTVHDGTTNEEVLAMLIDRMDWLIEKLPSRESAIARTKLDEALMWLHKRTEDRKARGVEGTHQP